MSEEKNKAIICSFNEAVNEQNLALLDDLIASDYLDHSLTKMRGLEGVKQFLTVFYRVFQISM